MNSILNKKGDMGPVMWIVIGVLTLLAIISVVIAMKGKSIGLIQNIFG